MKANGVKTKNSAATKTTKGQFGVNGKAQKSKSKPSLVGNVSDSDDDAADLLNGADLGSGGLDDLGALDSDEDIADEHHRRHDHQPSLLGMLGTADQANTPRRQQESGDHLQGQRS